MSEEFEKIYFMYYSRLCVFASKILKDPSTSKSIVQEVFLKVYENFDKIKIDTSWEGYLVRSVYNNCLLFKRRSALHKRHADLIRNEIDMDEVGLHDTELDDEELARIQLAQSAIESLPEQCRKVFIMNKKDGLSYARIALLLGISVKTVDNHLTKAMKKIRDHIGKK